MVEKVNSKVHPKSEAAASRLPAHLLVKTDKVRTPGWRLFDFIAHWVINWGGNITASIITAQDTWKYKRNKAIREGKLEGETENLLLGSVSEWFHAFTEKAEKKWFQPFWDTIMPGRLVKEGKGKGKDNPEDKYKYGRQQAVGITSGVFILSFGGHLTTLIAQVFETPRIKRRLVRWLDNNVTDPIRRLFGKGPSEAELEERKAVYDKLDNELSGKSAIGMWGSRFAGIGMVILSMITLGAIDKALIKDNPNLHPDPEKNKDMNEELRGFGRAPQGVFALFKNIEERKKAKDPKFKGFKFLQPPQEGEFVDESGRNYAQFMARMTALEVVGSTITAVTQYLYLMAQEFFGFGADTNVKRTPTPAAQTTPPVAERTAEDTPKHEKPQQQETAQAEANGKAEVSEKHTKKVAHKKDQTVQRRPENHSEAVQQENEHAMTVQ